MSSAAPLPVPPAPVPAGPSQQKPEFAVDEGTDVDGSRPGDPLSSIPDDCYRFVKSRPEGRWDKRSLVLWSEDGMM